MKINILTQPLFSNYGGILQNYALQTALRRLGHDPLTVNVPTGEACHSARWKEYLKTAINASRKMLGDYESPFLNPYTWAVKERELSFSQREFVARHINKVDEAAPFKADVCVKYPADAWIVGSDQVWRPWCSPHIANCFLDFVPDDVAKISYAASFGTDMWEISPELTRHIKPLAKRFRAVSVRELSGAGLCEQHLGVRATPVLDPTMLLTADDYLSITGPDDHPGGRYIAAYVLDNNRQKRKAVRDLAKACGLPVEKVGVMHRDRFDSVEYWLSTIAHAEYVITDSFHGTVFSIIFRRTVMVLGNNVRGNTRLKSLIDSLYLKSDSKGFFRIDNKVQERIQELKDGSLNFLMKSLINNG